MFEVGPKNSKTKHFFSQVWTCVTSLTKTKTLLPVGRMLSLGPWPRVLPKPYETMFNMHKNKRLLWGVHDQKRARPRTRKEQPGALLYCSTIHRHTHLLEYPYPNKNNPKDESFPLKTILKPTKSPRNPFKPRRPVCDLGFFMRKQRVTRGIDGFCQLDTMYKLGWPPSSTKVTTRNFYTFCPGFQPKSSLATFTGQGDNPI